MGSFAAVAAAAVDLLECSNKLILKVWNFCQHFSCFAEKETNNLRNR